MKDLKDIFEGIFDDANKNNVGKDLEPYSELEIISFMIMVFKIIIYDKAPCAIRHNSEQI